MNSQETYNFKVGDLFYSNYFNIIGIITSLRSRAGDSKESPRLMQIYWANTSKTFWYDVRGVINDINDGGWRYFHIKEVA